MKPMGYVVLMAVAALCGFIKLFLLGRLLSQADFGLYAYIAMVTQYAVPIAGLGILDGLSRRYALLLGESRTTEATELRNQCLGTVCLAAAGTMAAVIAAAQALHWRGWAAATLMPLAAADIFAMVAFLFGLRDIRSRLHAFTYAGLMAGRSLLDLLVMVLFTAKLGVPWLLAGEAVVLALVALAAFVWLIPGARLSLGGYSAVKTTAAEGFLIVAAGVLGNTALMGDRLVLGSVLPKSEYAVYGFHMLLATAAIIVSNMVYQYVSPKVLRLYGQAKDIGQVISYLGRLSGILAGLSIAGALIILFAFKWMASYFFPTYPLDPWMLAAIYAGAAIELSNVYPLAFLAVGRLWEPIGIHALISLCVIGLVLIILQSTRTLLPFALTFAAGRLASISVFFIASRTLRRSGPETRSVAMEIESCMSCT